MGKSIANLFDKGEKEGEIPGGPRQGEHFLRYYAVGHPNQSTGIELALLRGCLEALGKLLKLENWHKKLEKL